MYIGLLYMKQYDLLDFQW